MANVEQSGNTLLPWQPVEEEIELREVGMMDGYIK